MVSFAQMKRLFARRKPTPDWVLRFLFWSSVFSFVFFASLDSPGIYSLKVEPIVSPRFAPLLLVVISVYAVLITGVCVFGNKLPVLSRKRQPDDRTFDTLIAGLPSVHGVIGLAVVLLTNKPGYSIPFNFISLACLIWAAWRLHIFRSSKSEPNVVPEVDEASRRNRAKWLAVTIALLVAVPQMIAITVGWRDVWNSQSQAIFSVVLNTAFAAAVSAALSIGIHRKIRWLTITSSIFAGFLVLLSIGILISAVFGL